VSELPFNKGGYLKPGGKVYFAPAGASIDGPPDQWQELGSARDPGFTYSARPDERVIRTYPPVIGTTLTLTCIPPKTRREKRERRASLRLMFGHWPTHWRTKRRQLIHNGGKP